MFKDLLLFEKARTPKEAIGFYLAFLFFLGLLAGMLAFFIVPQDPSMSFEEQIQAGVIVGQYFGVIACLILSFVVLYKKKKLQSFGPLLVLVLSGFCAIFLGALLGLIPTAYLTTLESNNSENES